MLAVKLSVSLTTKVRCFRVPFVSFKRVSKHFNMHRFNTGISQHPVAMLFFIASFLLLFTSCQKEDRTGDGVQGAKTILNVAYGSDTAQRMDVYLPAGRSDAETRVIVMIHGGSWTSGNKFDLAPYVDTFKRRMSNLAIINIGYRLASGTRPFPVPEQDVKAAIEYIVSNAADWDINEERIGLLGVSAGAHLALLQAYKQTAPVRIKAVVDFFGPTDLVTMYRQPWHPLVPLLLTGVTGTTPDANLALYQSSSPLQFVTAQSPPTFILHGGADEVVHISQSTALKTKLDAAGVTNQLQVYPTEGHGWFGANMTHSFNLVQAFLNTHL